MKLLITAEASREVEAIDAWLREHRDSSRAFREELHHLFQLLVVTPELGALYLPKAKLGVRRVLLRKSQHYVYYVYRRSLKLVRILSVWSCYRGEGPPLSELRRIPAAKR